MLYYTLEFDHNKAGKILGDLLAALSTRINEPTDELATIASSLEVNDEVARAKPGDGYRFRNHAHQLCIAADGRLARSITTMIQMPAQANRCFNVWPLINPPTKAYI